jgi:SAM-dependent methyltransferase
MLAPRVNKLTGADISSNALRRAKERCNNLINAQFIELDFYTQKIPGDYDLVVCSEVLYYCESKAQLRGVVTNIVSSLRAGGYVLAAHGTPWQDGVNDTGFVWDVEFNGDDFVEAFKTVGAMTVIREVRSPLYRITLFQKSAKLLTSSQHVEPNVVYVNTGSINSELAGTIKWKGAPLAREEVYAAATEHLVPILMYHSIDDECSSHPAGHYRVTRAGFEEQLISLRREGFRSISMSELSIADKGGTLCVGYPIILTFDDGYKDFIQNALPLLNKYGFTASLYIPTG